jgi:phosphoglycerol transferase MdoB-like AlkP superfamily enzyme
MIKEKLIKSISYLVVSLAMLSMLRVVLLVIYPDDFNTLDLSELLLSLFTGIRVDLISILTFVSPFVILIFLPFGFTNSKLVSRIVGYGWYIVLASIIFIILADIIYFEHVHRHIGNEITAMANDTHVIIDMIIEYKFLLLLYIFLLIALFYIFIKVINRDFKYSPAGGIIKNTFLFFIVLIFMVVLIRGKIVGKPFSMTDAFVVNKTASGNLALNGFYTLYRTISKKKTIYNFYPEKDALKITRKLLSSSRFKYTDSEFPLQRSILKKQKSLKHNVVIILLESWSSKFVDSFGDNSLKVTPHFDKIVKSGIKFPNFYANGQRSIAGITAILTGIPVLEGFSYLGSGLELSNMGYLGDLAKQNGYSTMAMQSSKRGSFRVDTIAKISGFDEFYGAEDMENIGDEDITKKPRFGTWDGNMFHFLNTKLSHLKEPFLSFAFTATTHIPFVSPGKKWEVYPHDTKNILGFLNTLKYADEKLGLFMQNARKEPWFDNTIFIFLADHTIGFGNDTEMLKGTNIKIKNHELENMKIPLVIYAPKIFKPSINTTIGSQADIIPTLIDMLNWHGRFSTLSNSLFSPIDEQFAMFSLGQTIGMVNRSGYIKHTLNKKLELTGDNTLEKKILASYQIVDMLLRTNTWSKTK